MAQRKQSHGSKRNFLRQLGLERAVKIAFGINIKGRIQPSKALDMPRSKVKTVTKRALGRRVNEESWLQKRLLKIEARKKRTEKDELQVVVNKMTNWQRTQWARAGYPKKLKTAKMYQNMQRRPTR